MLGSPRDKNNGCPSSKWCRLVKIIEGKKSTIEGTWYYLALWYFEIEGTPLSITIYFQDLTNGFYWRKIFIALPQCTYQIKHYGIARAIARSITHQNSHSEPPQMVIWYVVVVWIDHQSHQLQEVMYMNFNRKVNLYFHFMQITFSFIVTLNKLQL